MGKYELTDKHRAHLKPWADRWIANALNCDTMSKTDKNVTRKAINGLYAAANLDPPDHIVFVQSPIVAAAAGGFAAYLWDRKDAGDEEGVKAGYDSMQEAAAKIATAAYGAPTREKVTRIGLAAALASNKAVGDYGEKTNFVANDDAVKALLECASMAHRMWNGGNQWSSWVAFLSFFRHVAKLDLDYSNWDHYEKAAIHSGPRIMHKHFTIVSDRPVYIHRDEQNRPHCDTGPFCEWRDGWKLWYIHGVRVNEQIVLRPDTLTVEQIRNEGNAEVRRVMMERFGAERYIQESGAQLVAQDDYGKLWRTTEPAPDEEDGQPWASLEVACPSTDRKYFLRVPPDMERAEQAWRWTLDVSDDAEAVGQS